MDVQVLVNAISASSFPFVCLAEFYCPLHSEKHFKGSTFRLKDVCRRAKVKLKTTTLLLVLLEAIDH